ncbi:universal stress protein [Aquincola sp. MAHUQ-54]|uniref:Universal stress protein n=1 Tax=Aquincola agrisoli TaxID=3119538 RepID=A0AAW9QDM6_9BURK
MTLPVLPPWMSGPPVRMLLATDLSARCDRALDRAVQLAEAWGADLVVLHVVEVPRAPDLVLNWVDGEDDRERLAQAREQLKTELAGLQAHGRVVLAHGATAAVIAEVAAREGCGLIVTGMARDEPFGRFLVGSTVEKLARSVPQPLLVVRNRPRAPYRKVVVASDFSPPSRHALHAASRFFPQAAFTLYNAQPPARPDLDAQRSLVAARAEAEEFIAGSDLPEALHRRLPAVVDAGAIESLLTRYVRDNGIDLAVIGTHGRGGLLGALLGSVAAQLLDWLPCDTLIVRAP